MRLRFVMICVFAAAPAVAQDMVFSPEGTEHCLASQQGQGNIAQCIGVSANDCMEQTPGGWSTAGMSGCLDQEWQYWDQRLNAAYEQVRLARSAADEENKSLGSAAPNQAYALKAMQVAWIAFRDATCDYERTLWSGGTGGGPASVSCHMLQTAKQALYLETDAMTQ